MEDPINLLSPYTENQLSAQSFTVGQRASRTSGAPKPRSWNSFSSETSQPPIQILLILKGPCQASGAKGQIVLSRALLVAQVRVKKVSVLEINISKENIKTWCLKYYLSSISNRP